MTSRNTCVALAAAALATAITAPAAADDHLLLCEGVLTPTVGEYIEIANPTAGAIALDDYYLSDELDYAILPGQFGGGPAPTIGSSDFMARFPAGASIGAGDVIVVAIDGAGFAATYGSSADFELAGTDPGVPDMLEAYAGSIGSSRSLTNGGEMTALFFWDGASDLVSDVDLVKFGTPTAANDLPDKTGLMVDGPDADALASTYLSDAGTMSQQAGDPGGGVSTKRLSLEAPNETQAGGNGITGHDETSENIAVTWDSVYTAPDPGICAGLNPPAGVTLIVNKSGPFTALAGTQITYTLTIQNTGVDPANDVEITDTLPALFSFVSELSPASVTNTDSTEPTIVWDAGTVLGGETVIIELTVAIDITLSGPQTNVVDITTTTAADDPSDNSDSQTTTVTPFVTPPTGLSINEIRVDQDGTDNDEYFELKGDPFTALDGLTYLVIGDGSAFDSGVIEEAENLTGSIILADGLFLAAESTYTLGGTVDKTTSINFENGDNVTHLLVANFSGSNGDDLDTDDDGVLDVTPWSDLLDAIGVIEEVNPPAGTEYSYGDALGYVDVGPACGQSPEHVYRCEPTGEWLPGKPDPAAFDATDTPDLPNAACPCPGDTNGDNVIDIDDIVNVVLDFDMDGSMNGGNVDGCGLVDIDDIVFVVLNFGNTCP